MAPVYDLENTASQDANGETGGTSPETGAGQAKAGAERADEATARATAAESESPTGPGVVCAPETGVSGPAAGAAAPEAGAVLGEIAASMREIADSADRYHTRAEQREGVIDHLRSELDLLRRGERRGLLRPVLTELCRLRDDLLKQAATLPADFDADRAADLLRSYAETIELTLESNGVVTYAPDNGDAFNPRMHRRVSGEPTADPALAGHIAGIQRDGYLDIEANGPIAPAEVTVFAVAKGEQEQ